MFFQKDTTADVLLHAVIYSCLEVGSLSKFTVALKSVDPTLESFRRELTAAGDYFMNKKMYNVAYVFQDLLQVSASVIVIFPCKIMPV